MTDGNTGIHVAPISEDDMNLVRNILQRAADAMVGMSQLAADVEMLRSTVSGLQADTDRLRQTNANLDEALAQVRKERDEAKQEVMNLVSRLGDAERNRDNYMYANDKANDAIVRLTQERDQARTERDDHGFKVMELEEALRAADAIIDKMREHVSSVSNLLLPQTRPIPTLAPVQDPHPIQAVSEAQLEPSAVPVEIDFAKPYHWDEGLRRWVNDEPKPDGEAIPF